MSNSVKIGIDFGTTNSSVALAHADGAVELVAFPTAAGTTESFRSVLYLEQSKAGIASFTGPSAIQQYLEAEHPGRLIQSLKSYLPSRSLTGTEVFGRRYTLEDLISRILTDLQPPHRADSRRIRSRPGRRRSPSAARSASSLPKQRKTTSIATERLRSAFTQAGYPNVTFELEPIAAAYAYEATLDHDELILIGDFGGGTSDFSLLHVGPSFSQASPPGRSSATPASASPETPSTHASSAS